MIASFVFFVFLTQSASALPPVADSVDGHYPVPTSPDQLIENLVRSFEELNIVEYERLLHDRFRFRFAPDHAYLAPPDGMWTREEDLRAVDELFNGVVHSRIGLTEPSEVVSIQLTMTPDGGWRQDCDGEVSRSYASYLVVTYTSGRKRVVSRIQRMTASPVRFEHNLDEPAFELVAWDELDTWRVSPTWGRVRARY